MSHHLWTPPRRLILNIVKSAEDLQLWTGQDSRSVAYIRALGSIFIEENCDAVLIVDPDNAFHWLKNKVMLRNMWIASSMSATYVINFTIIKLDFLFPLVKKCISKGNYAMGFSCNNYIFTTFIAVVRFCVTSEYKTWNLCRWLGK